jgi:hypothetical protein
MRRRERKPRVCAGVDEEGCRAVAEGGRRVVESVMANSAGGRWASQSSLRPLAKARSASLMTPLACSTLALVFLWYAEQTTRHEPRPKRLYIYIYSYEIL